MGSFWPKYIKFLSWKSAEELSFMAVKSDAKFEENLTFGLENDIRNLASFHQSTWRSQSWDFDGILLPKVESVWAKNLQRNFV